MAIKVLVMGGHGCGKTTTIVSSFYQMIHGETSRFLTAEDCTKVRIEGTDSESQKINNPGFFENKRLKLQNLIGAGGNRTFLVDEWPTSMIWDYTLRVQIPGTVKAINIEFRDLPGSFFYAGTPHHYSIIESIKDSDVFVIVVDTPYLMVGTPEENNAVNIVDSLHTFLTEINDDGGRKAKQVIFVPVKCEKWFKEGTIDSVTAKVEQTYATTIRDLKTITKIEIGIIPILTIGDILFSELRKPYTITKTGTNTIRRCSKINDRLVVLENGEAYSANNETLYEDVNYGLPGTNFTKRAEWFHLSTDKMAEYRPYNCEQLPLHIIRFMLNKEITLPIKDTGEGIKCIKRCF